MKLRILPAAALALFCATTLVVACGDDDPITPNPVDNNQTDTTVVDTAKTDTTQTDSIPADTTQTDTTQIDTTEVEPPVDSVVAITWTSTGATVNVDATLAGSITYTVDGANVTVTNTNTTDEFLFVLSGTSANGSFTYNGSYKASFELNGLSLQASTGAAIDIQCGKRIKLILADGTENSLADAAGGTQKAALNCQGHMEVSGGGSLAIAGHTNHALRTKEYLQLKASTGAIAITAAAADGIHCGEFYEQNGGDVTISGTAKDGLQVETDDDSDEALNGQLIVRDGTLTVNVASEDVKGIRLDAAAAASAPTPQMTIAGGTVKVVVAATADGSKGIASDGNITIGNGSATTPVVDVTVLAGQYEDPITDDTNRATGIKADYTLHIAGGTTTVAANGTKSRGVRAATLRATAGTLTVTNNSSSQGIKLDNQYQSEGGTVSGKFKY